jgi:hypothetical protein
MSRAVDIEISICESTMKAVQGCMAFNVYLVNSLSTMRKKTWRARQLESKRFMAITVTMKA